MCWKNQAGMASSESLSTDGKDRIGSGWITEFPWLAEMHGKS